MADIKVERRQQTPWMWWVLGAIVVLLVLWALFAALTPDRNPNGVANAPENQIAATNGTVDDQGNLMAGREASLVVPYQGHEWVPADVGQAASFSDNQMQRVATVNGVNLYANPDEGLGGGGGGVNAPDNLETQPYGRIYVRMSDGRYLPMVWRDANQQ